MAIRSLCVIFLSVMIFFPHARGGCCGLFGTSKMYDVCAASENHSLKNSAESVRTAYKKLSDDGMRSGGDTLVNQPNLACDETDDGPSPEHKKFTSNAFIKRLACGLKKIFTSISAFVSPQEKKRSKLSPKDISMTAVSQVALPKIEDEIAKLTVPATKALLANDYVKLTHEGSEIYVLKTDVVNVKPAANLRQAFVVHEENSYLVRSLTDEEEVTWRDIFEKKSCLALMQDIPRERKISREEKPADQEEAKRAWNLAVRLQSEHPERQQAILQAVNDTIKRNAEGATHRKAANTLLMRRCNTFEKKAKNATKNDFLEQSRTQSMLAEAI